MLGQLIGADSNMHQDEHASFYVVAHWGGATVVSNYQVVGDSQMFEVFLTEMGLRKDADPNLKVVEQLTQHGAFLACTNAINIKTEHIQHRPGTQNLTQLRI